MERAGPLELEEREQRLARDPSAPVRAADPVGDLTVALVAPAPDRADRLTLVLDRLQQDAGVAAQPLPALGEGGAVARVRRRERGHP